MRLSVVLVSTDFFVFHDFASEVFGLAPVPPLGARAGSRPSAGLAEDDGALTIVVDSVGSTAVGSAATAPSPRAGSDHAAAEFDASETLAAADVETGEPVAVAAQSRPTCLANVRARARNSDPDDFGADGKAVVVIDTGWSPWYDKSNMVYSFDFSGQNDRNASVDTRNSHGSWVAQTLTNVAADVDIIHLKVFDNAGANATLADIEEALKWTIRNVDKYDISAVNLSLAYGNVTRSTKTVLSDEFEKLDSKGVISVVAAGNDGDMHASGVSVIAADRNVIGVSATTAAGRFTDWTQRHASLTDIAALGDSVAVETIHGGVRYVSGTSFAAPYVAGTIARLQQATEKVFGAGAALDDAEVLSILRASGDRVRGAPKSWTGAVEADADAAVAWFLDHAVSYADAVWA